MSMFNVGDRIVTTERAYSVVQGRLGVVKHVEGSTENASYAVEFDNTFGEGHACDGYCERYRGYWLRECMMELEMPREERIVDIAMKDNMKNKINELFNKHLKIGDVTELNNEKERKERYINEYKEKLTRFYRELKDVNLKICALENNTQDFYAKIQEVSRSSKIEKLEVDMGEKEFIAYTTDLLFHTMNGAHYHGGKYKIVYNPKTNGVRFYSTEEWQNRRSYWSDKDPHPHVNGRTGEACLGNTSDSLAYLAGEHEYQVVFEMLVAFLEQANIDDPAGRHAMNWDKVELDGTLIREGSRTLSYIQFVYDKANHENDTIEEEQHYCTMCEEYHDEDDGFEIDGEWICDTCRDNNYTRCEDCGEWVHDDDKWCVRNVHNEEIYVCEHCRDEHYTTCDCCSEIYHDDNIREVNDGCYCVDCRNDKFIECHVCDEWVNKDDAYYEEDGQVLCKECHDENEEEEEEREEEEENTFECGYCRDLFDKEEDGIYVSEEGVECCVRCFNARV